MSTIQLANYLTFETTRDLHLSSLVSTQIAILTHSRDDSHRYGRVNRGDCP